MPAAWSCEAFHITNENACRVVMRATLVFRIYSWHIFGACDRFGAAFIQWAPWADWSIGIRIADHICKGPLWRQVSQLPVWYYLQPLLSSDEASVHFPTQTNKRRVLKTSAVQPLHLQWMKLFTWHYHYTPYIYSKKLIPLHFIPATNGTQIEMVPICLAYL